MVMYAKCVDYKLFILPTNNNVKVCFVLFAQFFIQHKK